MHSNYSADSTTTCKMPTMAEMEGMIDKFLKRFPPSEMPQAIECPPSTEQCLLDACGQMFPQRRHDAFGRIDGLPIETNMAIPYQAYAIRYGDGSKVCHYPNGFRVKCLGNN